MPLASTIKEWSGESSRFDALSPYLLLVAEDCPLVRDYYSEILSSAGYHFDLVENGEAAWDNVKARKYSLIITDHDMPRLTGLGLISRLDEQDYKVPVFLVSGTLAQNGARVAGNCLLCMISKPFVDSSLLSQIQEALNLNLPIWFTQPLPELVTR